MLLETAPPPHGKSRAAYLIFVLLGAGVLAPWNIILNTVSYLKAEYDGPDGTESALGSHASVAFYLTAAYTWPQVPVLHRLRVLRQTVQRRVPEPNQPLQ